MLAQKRQHHVTTGATWRRQDAQRSASPPATRLVRAPTTRLIRAPATRLANLPTTMYHKAPWRASLTRNSLHDASDNASNNAQATTWIPWLKRPTPLPQEARPDRTCASRPSEMQTTYIPRQGTTGTTKKVLDVTIPRCYPSGIHPDSNCHRDTSRAKNTSRFRRPRRATSRCLQSVHPRQETGPLILVVPLPCRVTCASARGRRTSPAVGFPSGRPGWRALCSSSPPVPRALNTRGQTPSSSSTHSWRRDCADDEREATSRHGAPFCPDAHP